MLLIVWGGGFLAPTGFTMGGLWVSLNRNTWQVNSTLDLGSKVASVASFYGMLETRMDTNSHNLVSRMR